MSKTLDGIWKSILEGDKNAWGELVDKYTVLVYSVAHRNGLNSADAEDCTQQTWMALYSSRFKIKEVEKIPNWLASTAYRRSMRILRKKISIEKIEKNSIESDPPITPYEHVIYLRRYEMLQKALDEMDERCAQLLKELFFSSEDVSYKEIAKKLKISMNSLGPTRKRCLEKLKKILAKYDINEY